MSMNKEFKPIETKTNKNVIKSIDFDQGTILKNIIKLYIPSGQISCDITYSKGNFYKKTGIITPIYKFDKYPQSEDILPLDEKISLNDDSISSLICDPPFIIGGNKKVNDYKDGSCLIGKRFEQYKNLNELLISYELLIKESYRVLQKDGIFIFKTQDQVSGGKQYLIHNFVNKIAVKYGFYPKDMFILLAKNRIISPKHNNQIHSRKFHSYFLIFKKQEFKDNYIYL